jgi:hypothetical protein
MSLDLWKKTKQYMHMQKTEMELQSLAIGMNSTVDITRDLHIIMLDTDIEDLDKVEESVWELQWFWNLSQATIFKTKHGHHVFFFYDLVPYGRLKQIIEFAKYVDPMYKAISRFYDHKTIRVAGKYQEQDIAFVKDIIGVRVPTEEEIELGDLKRKEHRFFVGEYHE